VALGDATIAVLRKYYLIQNEERKVAGGHWADSGLIFTTRNGTIIHLHNLLSNYKIQVPLGALNFV
jgi:hypothetical protein